MATKKPTSEQQQPSQQTRPDEEIIRPESLTFVPSKSEFRRKKSRGDEAGAASEPMDVIAIQMKVSREARGLSISQLHAETGIARTALHDYEAGRYKPGANEIRKLCAALGITPNKLLTGRDNPETPETPLNKLFGGGGASVQVMKAGQLLHMLPMDERDAFYKLLLGLVSARYPAEQIAAVFEKTEALAGVMNFMAAQVTNPGEEISEEAVKKRMAEINPDLVSDERAERVRREREAERSKAPPAPKEDK